MNEVLRWFDQVKDWGFTPAQAHALWIEHRVLASPILWSHKALRHDEKLRAIAWTHRTLRERLLMVDHPRAWNHYWKSMPERLLHIEKKISQYMHSGSIRDYWPIIAMGEYGYSYDNRIKGLHQESHPLNLNTTVYSWDDLIDLALRTMVLERLSEQAPSIVNENGGDQNQKWQSILYKTGLRSIRWGWLDNVSATISQERLRQGLLLAQRLLSNGVGWEGRILGLGGNTSLVLMDRGHSDGLVQPDIKGKGQTLTIDTWTILAHEWLHILDRQISKISKGNKSWATTTLLNWEHEKEPNPLLLSWFEIMARVMLESPPEEVLKENQQEIPHWAFRITMALGGLGEVREEIIRQQHMIDNHTWSISTAENGWLRILDDRPLTIIPPKTRRTAQLLARDTLYGLEVKNKREGAGWMDYLNTLPENDISGNPCKAGDPGCPRYLTHPIEIMARSFEASMGCDRTLDSIWMPYSLRPNAGLMWPLLAETRFQREAWQKGLGEICSMAGKALGIKTPKSTI